MTVSAGQRLAMIHDLCATHLRPDGMVRIMNVCGGHERTITMAGMRKALPENIELIPGPGCPVCVCPEEDLYEAIQLALQRQVTLLAFGDMLRVPVNLPRREPRSLQDARAAGADIRPIASPLEAVQIAEENPDRPVVFFVAGFETTMAPVAAMLAQGIPDNLLLLLSGRRTWPAVAMLLDTGQARFDALIAPGHVSTVMGAGEWEFVSTRHRIPTAIAGFTADTLLAGIYSVLRQILEKHSFLDNCYPELVNPQGNPAARACLQNTMNIIDANWRGIGIIPASGYDLKPAWTAHNARHQFKQMSNMARKHVGEMPPGCDCARVVLGQILPNECKLYGRACTPGTPVGPCMVSDEGACRIWWAGGTRQSQNATICIN
jgi:hydrogenase expression/formation protein HypD